MTLTRLTRALTLGALTLGATKTLAASPPLETSPAGEEAEARDAAPPERVTLEVTRLERPLYQTPYATTSFDAEQIGAAQPRLTLDEALIMAPGVSLQNQENFAQGLRIAIRGAGARAPFGVRGLTLWLDGIPYTLPDGQAQLDAIELDAARHIELLRGPSAVPYGNASNGVLILTTEDGRDLPFPSARLDLLGGSFGLRKLTVSQGGALGPWSQHASLSTLSSAGYRDQSEVKKHILRARLRRELTARRALSATVNLLETPRAHDPGGLKLEEVEADRSAAAPAALTLDAGQRVRQQSVGLTYEDRDLARHALTSRAFYTHRAFAQQLPYVGDSAIAYARHHFGANLQLARALAHHARTLRYVVGLDLASQRDARTRDEVDPQGVLIARLNDELQLATTAGAFAQLDRELLPALLLSLGARYDHTVMHVEDHHLQDGDDSGQRQFSLPSGSAGLSYTYLPAHQLYLSTGSSFETPTFAEFADPTGRGGLNPQVAPQQSWNRELGARGHLPLSGSLLTYEAALFSTRAYSELLPYEQQGRTFYRNAGQIHRDGAELALRYAPSFGLYAESALTVGRYTLARFQDDQGDHAGNRLPGMPRHLLNARLGFSAAEHGRLFLEGRYRGALYADNANTVEEPAVFLLNLRATTSLQLATHTFTLYGGVNNLLDAAYSANVRVNASYGRTFEPASPRGGYIGLSLDL